MQNEMRNISREMDILRKKQKEMLQMKNIVTDMKNALGLAIDWIQPRKESVSLKTRQ